HEYVMASFGNTTGGTSEHLSVHQCLPGETHNIIINSDILTLGFKAADKAAPIYDSEGLLKYLPSLSWLLCSEISEESDF
ncbi:hypothetical protein CEXT_24821, partial [Caerostris extrusa]